MSEARGAAFAPSNIALTKYWGKRDETINLPLADSISVALDGLGTFTIVEPHPGLERDVMVVNDEPLDDAGMTKVRRVLELVRELSGQRGLYAGLRAVNTVPTAQGLASSASAFGALAMAACQAYGLAADERLLSALARTGSGSAARSIHGGFVRWHRGHHADGRDSFATQVAPAAHWPLEIVVAHVAGGRKDVSSTEGMRRCKATSPYFEAWIDACHRDVEACAAAIAARDFATLTEVVEGNALAMHASMIATRPSLIYWRPATLSVIDRVRSLRERDGLRVLLTIDAGPSVVTLTHPDDTSRVQAALSAVPGVVRAIRTRIGGGARLVDGAPA